MSLIQQVRIDPRPVDSFVSILGQDGVESVQRLAAEVRGRLGGRVIWNVNSTAAGGGVAEMLHTLLAYARGLGVDTRWLVLTGEPDFFRITKRIHNALHGEAGDGSQLDDRARQAYERVTEANAAELHALIRPGDVAILHDPQTAGLIPGLVERGVGVVWRCHIGNDVPTVEDGRAWDFLERYLCHAHAFIFSRFSYLPDMLYHGRCLVIAPSIDPFSPKNQDLDDMTVRGILEHTGLIDGQSGAPRTFSRSDGTRVSVERRADVVREGGPPSPGTPLVVQVSRWDGLKDPIGVARGFVSAISMAGADGAHLVLAGPNVAGVSDDPEGAETFDKVLAYWKSLPVEHRSRIHLVNLPMDDLQENAVMVNALQRHAAIVVQKSLREGFGLTVTEAMWKARPVVASAVGGILDQIDHGVSGLLLRNPTDVDSLAGAITQLLGKPGLASRLGQNARRRVIRNFLGLRLLAMYADLLERLESDPQAVEPHSLPT